MKRALLASSLLVLSATAVLADRIDDRQTQQWRRIEQGVHSGQLSWREARELRSEHARIGFMIRRARADGHINWREAQVIEAAQDAASRHIFAEKHDGQKGWYGRRW